LTHDIHKTAQRAFDSITSAVEQSYTTDVQPRDDNNKRGVALQRMAEILRPVSIVVTFSLGLPIWTGVATVQ